MIESLNKPGIGTYDTVNTCCSSTRRKTTWESTYFTEAQVEKPKSDRSNTIDISNNRQMLLNLSSQQTQIHVLQFRMHHKGNSKTHQRLWKNICKSYSDKGYVCRIYKEHLPLHNNKKCKNGQNLSGISSKKMNEWLLNTWKGVKHH